MKIVGKRLGPRPPEECLRIAEEMIREAELLARTPPREPFVFKARTREEYENWKQRQTDPRYW